MKAEDKEIEKTLASLEGMQRAVMPAGLEERILASRSGGMIVPMFSLPRLAVAASLVLCVLNGALLASDWSAASDEQGVETFAEVYKLEIEDTYESLSTETESL